MKKTTLFVEYSYDFGLFGLVASCKEHKLAWALNKHFKLRLIKQQDLVYEFQKNGFLQISNYLHATDHSLLRLFRNKSVGLSTLKKPYLLPDIKEYDYIIQVDGAVKEREMKNLHRVLKSLQLVEYVQEFEPEKLQHKENLIF